MSKQNDRLFCNLCGKRGARLVPITETYGTGKDLLVIQNIPMYSCRLCAESYFTAETLHEIERIKQHRKGLAVRRSVEVASFKAAPRKLARAV
jgi:YgiT-type zinc finger domain-containing protein